MELKGIVTNVTAFGAFVDIGVHQDGLVHISQLCDRFISDPSEAVQAGDRITVRVLEVDLDRKRISLTARNEVRSASKGTPSRPQSTQQKRGPQQQQRRQPPRGFSNNRFAGL